MCSAPDIEAPPPPAERQPMQNPKEAVGVGASKKRRRGMWASIFTSPQGVTGMPTVTGGGSTMTGG